MPDATLLRSLTLSARGSPLSRVQVRLAEEELRRHFPGTELREIWLTTTGDRSRKMGFEDLPTPGVFEKEVDEAVLDGRADLGIHSLKDIPTDLPKGLAIVAALARGPSGDLLVGRDKVPPTIGRLPSGARVGTSSVRRRAMVLYHSPEAKPVPLRGNVGTRVRKLEEGECDLLLLAEAGVTRLGLHPPSRKIPINLCPPAPGQGIVALVARADRSETFSGLRDAAPYAWWELLVERAFLQEIGGGCSQALGGQANRALSSFTAAEWAEDGHAQRRITVSSRGRRPEEFGRYVAEQLREAPWVER
jgi:hydroxymethylbilane synthase